MTTETRVEHTRGPWAVAVNASGSEREMGVHWLIGGPANEHVGSAVNRSDGTGEANAHLIAAAPDLLAACESALAESEGDHWSCDFDSRACDYYEIDLETAEAEDRDPHYWLRDLRDAIARARGES